MRKLRNFIFQYGPQFTVASGATMVVGSVTESIVVSVIGLAALVLTILAILSK